MGVFSRTQTASSRSYFSPIQPKVFGSIYRQPLPSSYLTDDSFGWRGSPKKAPEYGFRFTISSYDFFRFREVKRIASYRSVPLSLLASVIAGGLWDRYGAATTFYVGAAFSVSALVMLTSFAPAIGVNGSAAPHGRGETSRCTRSRFCFPMSQVRQKAERVGEIAAKAVVQLLFLHTGKSFTVDVLREKLREFLPEGGSRGIARPGRAQNVK